MLYCAKFYGGGFGRVYEPKTPVIKLCTVQHYSIIRIFEESSLHITDMQAAFLENSKMAYYCTL